VLDKKPEQLKERNKQLGALMQEARRYKGETVKRCAEEYLGTTRQRYDLMERGEANIGWAEFAQLMERLGIADEWLLPRMRERGLMLGVSFNLAAERPPAREERHSQRGTTTPVESSPAALQQQEHASNGQSASVGAEAPSVSSSSSPLASSQATVPPIPTVTAEHVLLPRVPGYGYTVQVLDAEGRIIYSMDWEPPGRKRLRPVRIRPMAGTQAKTTVTASI
jgi:hypothetical protein